MPWFKVDDQFWSHPKVVELSADAVALWVRAGSYAAQHLTDGKVTTGALRMLGGAREIADELVLGGLWDQVDNRTWQFRDWFDYQPTAEEVADRRAKRSAAGKKGAESRWHGKSDGNPMANAMADGSQTDAPSPSRTRDFYSPSKSQSRNTRAKLTTDAIEVSDMTRRLAAQKGITSLRAIVDAIARHTAVKVTADQAFQVCTHLLEKAKYWPDAPQRYVLSCIEQSPAEVQKHLYEHIGVAS
ncbi:hypothetical protein C7474_2234 [Microbacterium telephonicum]|uniref:Uncharacterized protein n=2 Tax=Microbacterium telephonicum TaxID=1714841 RepID=A0A498BXF8_9MICO|nr:hypothetical protein C7474_2234 [Microbacterium telephonicum]